MARAYVSSVGEVEKQSKSVEIAINGSYDIVPDAGKLFDKVTVDVNVTETLEEVTMANKGDAGCRAIYNTNTFDVGVIYDNIHGCYYADVIAGEKYKVICSPMNPDNLWENFLLGTDDTNSGMLAVTANDESVGQYVTKVDDTTYTITVPDNCRNIHVNCTIADGCKLYIVNNPYDKGFEDGKKSEYDAFWDAYQQNGTRKNYLGAFVGVGWNATTFKPKHPISVSDGVINASQMFWHHNAGITPYDFAKHCRDNDIIIDFSVCNYLYNTFSYAYISTVGEIDFKSIPKADSYNWNGLFLGSQLETIEKLVFYETNPPFTNSMFQNCTRLKNLIAEGIIAKNGLNLQWSTSLSKASIEIVISCLSSTTSGLSVTLSKAAVDKAFETGEGYADGSDSASWNALLNTKSNWTISLV